MIMCNAIVGFAETTKPSLKAHLWKIVPLKYCMEKAHEKRFFFPRQFNFKNVCNFKKWDSHVITALCFDIGLLLAAVQDDLAVTEWLCFSLQNCLLKNVYKLQKKSKMCVLKSKFSQNQSEGVRRWTRKQQVQILVSSGSVHK